MYLLRYAKDFSKSLRRHLASGRFPRNRFEELLDLLKTGKSLPSHYRDHVLAGEYRGCHECHIQGDLLLIYEKHDNLLVLVMVNLGTHRELFGT